MRKPAWVVADQHATVGSPTMAALDVAIATPSGSRLGGYWSRERVFARSSRRPRSLLTCGLVPYEPVRQ